MPEPEHVSVAGGEVSQADLANIVGLSTRQIRNLEREGLPHRADGNRKLYPVPAAVQWWRDREVAAALGKVQVSTLDALKARNLEAEAEKRELELAERRGLLITLAHHTEILGVVFDRVRSRLVSWSATLPPLLVGLEVEREIQGVIAPAVDEVLAQLQTVGDDPSEPAEGGEDDDAAA